DGIPLIVDRHQALDRAHTVRFSAEQDAATLFRIGRRAMMRDRLTRSFAKNDRHTLLDRRHALPLYPMPRFNRISHNKKPPRSGGRSTLLISRTTVRRNWHLVQMHWLPGF